MPVDMEVKTIMGCPYKAKRGGLDYCNKVELYIHQLMTCADNNNRCCYKSAEQVRIEEREKKEREEEEWKEREREQNMYQQNTMDSYNNYEYEMFEDNYDDDYTGKSHMEPLPLNTTWKDVVISCIFLLNDIYYIKSNYGVPIIMIGMTMIAVAMVVLTVNSVINNDNKMLNKIDTISECIILLGIVLTALGFYQNWSFQFLIAFIITYFSPIILFFAGIWTIQWLWDVHQEAVLIIIAIIIFIIFSQILHYIGLVDF